MLRTLAIENYRSLRKFVLPLGELNIITGANGSGKSNLYRAVRLLAETAQGGVVNSLAREGGLESTFWAGPEDFSRRMRSGEVGIEGGPRRKTMRLKLGFAGDDFGYSISLGLPAPSCSAFSLDPEIKRECIWAGPVCRPAALLVDRNGPVVRARSERQWEVIHQSLNTFDSVFSQMADPKATPELFLLREKIRGWRFYDYFRTDKDATCRSPQLGTRTPALSHDGSDLAAALQTICEIGDSDALNQAVSDAFPGSELSVGLQPYGRFSIEFRQHGLLRPLSGAELSDGTLRYLLWIAALLTPRPPSMMVLNEPETSLHPDLLPALAKLIIQASQRSQVWVVSHAEALIGNLKKSSICRSIDLEKELGETRVAGQGLLDKPVWRWPDER